MTAGRHRDWSIHCRWATWVWGLYGNFVDLWRSKPVSRLVATGTGPQDAFVFYGNGSKDNLIATCYLVNPVPMTNRSHQERHPNERNEAQMMWQWVVLREGVTTWAHLPPWKVVMPGLKFRAQDAQNNSKLSWTIRREVDGVWLIWTTLQRECRQKNGCHHIKTPGRKGEIASKQ